MTRFRVFGQWEQTVSTKQQITKNTAKWYNEKRVKKKMQRLKEQKVTSTPLPHT